MNFARSNDFIWNRCNCLHASILDRSMKCDNYAPKWWVEFQDELSWSFTNRFSATRYMKVKRMGITEILRRIWLSSANKTKSSELFSEQPTQLIFDLNSSLQHIIVTILTFLNGLYRNTNFQQILINKFEVHELFLTKIDRKIRSISGR